MQSIREIYRIGKGPSSSHTMGPEKAALLFIKEHPHADSYKAILYGSLSKTGRGHMTDEIILQAFRPRPIKVEFCDEADFELPHDNTLDFLAYKGHDASGAPIEVARMRAMSIGGGEIVVEGRPHLTPPDIYPHNTFDEICDYCREQHLRLSDYVLQYEDPAINEFLTTVWSTMETAIAEGLAADGILPGGLRVVRRAKQLYISRNTVDDDVSEVNRLVCSYAFAVSEQNAGGGTIVTAPTCGACGVLPAVLKYYQERDHLSDETILRALRTAGLIGNIVKKNASISGAECGCQAEIGTACCMAAAAVGELFDLGLDQIEGAAEMALEHFLGLTCDPVCGLVQIPCIERNAVAAMRAMNACYLSDVLATTGKVSFDTVVKTMYQTGRDLHASYRETAEGGLAQMYKPE